MTPEQQMLNRFLVEVFGDILRLEEASLRKHCPHLSVTELHVLEAVAGCKNAGAKGISGTDQSPNGPPASLRSTDGRGRTGVAAACSVPPAYGRTSIVHIVPRTIGHSL